MLFVMVRRPRASRWFGTTVIRWTISGRSRPIAMDAMNQNATVMPTGQSDAREGAAEEQRRGDRRDGRQQVVGDELGVLVGVGHAGRDPARAVDEIELAVELVAESDDHQEQGREDAEVDADASVEDRRSADRGEQVARPDDQRGAAISRPLASLEEPEGTAGRTGRTRCRGRRSDPGRPSRTDRTGRRAARAGSSARSRRSSRRRRTRSAPITTTITGSARAGSGPACRPGSRRRDRGPDRPRPPHGSHGPRWRDRSAFAAASFSDRSSPLIVPPSPVDGDQSAGEPEGCPGGPRGR